MLSKEELEILKRQVAISVECGEIQRGYTYDLLENIDAMQAQIDKLEENATAQALALKAAKAMQQSETERADANERDAERYRKLRDGGDGCSVAVVTNPHQEFIDDGESWGGVKVNAYDEEIAGDKLDTTIDSM